MIKMTIGKTGSRKKKRKWCRLKPFRCVDSGGSHGKERMRNGQRQGSVAFRRTGRHNEDAGLTEGRTQMIRSKRVSRRGALKLGAAAAALPLVHIRTAGAAGKVAIGFWDHWVPGGNDIMQKQVNAWAEKNKVEVTADFITGNGNKLLMTGAAEAQAKTGHDVYDVLQLGSAQPAPNSLRPVDDVMKRLTGKYGAVDKTCAVSGEEEGLGGGADQLRHADQAALRADQLVQEARPRRAGDVSGEAGAHRGAGRVDLGYVPEICRAGEEGRHDVRAWAWAAAPTPTRSTRMARCSAPSAPC